MSTKKVSIQPIQDMQFAGLHWIEASAGTGKTYTLSSLMVRIFLEKHLPSQVIATTFTRKAAAELKSRIRARLVETWRYLEGCREFREQQFLEEIKAQQNQDVLFAKVLEFVIVQNDKDLEFSTRIAYACERLKLVIDQIDEIFVGTLDSFSQKLLREFAFESGKIERAEITDDAQAYTQQLIHDVLREWIQQQPQQVIDYLLLNKKLKTQAAYVAVVENSLNFASAKFQAIAQPSMDIAQFEQAIAELVQLDLTQVAGLADYYSPEGAHFKLVGKKWRDDGRMQVLLNVQLGDFIAALAQQGVQALYAAQHANTLKLLTDLSTKKVLNKCPDEVLQAFEQHALIQALQRFCLGVQQMDQDLDTLDSYLQYYLASEVKKRLPQVLQHKGETTFAQQIRTLAEALQGQQGQRFASFVHARYPLILVDEFQDTNQDQDDMLAQIWRHPQRVNQGCMIMVGDRKQAIYGFRGGDMLTFLKAHQDVFGKSGHAYNLIYNHRSVAPLVEVVDALFQCQMDFGEQVIYSPVQAGSRPHPDLIDAGQSNPTPLRWLELEDKNTEAEQVAWKIRDLLNQAIDGSLYFVEKSGNRALDENDIAVLSRNHHALDKVQSALEFLGVRVSRPSKKSVFESQMARDTAALLGAILNPFDEAKVKRALVSRMLGFNLEKLIKLQAQADGLSAYIEQLDLIREKWFKQGFLSAWQYCLSQFNVWQNIVAQASRDNERAVVNLRHLSELLSQHSEDVQGAQNLYHWYLKQMTAPLQREWELERKLSNEAGVQLMTIHQSKGLEFKVVFLLGADADFKEMNKTLNFSTREQLNPQTGQLEQQRIVAVNDKNILNPAEIEQHNHRAVAEQHRLWYVALTRASYRVYAMMQDTQGKSNGLAFWRGHAAATFQHPQTQVEALLEQRPVQRYVAKALTTAALYAETFPQQRFYARGKTSFSYLAQHLSRKQIQDAMTVAEQVLGGAEDEVDQVQVSTFIGTVNKTVVKSDTATVVDTVTETVVDTVTETVVDTEAETITETVVDTDAETIVGTEAVATVEMLDDSGQWIRANFPKGTVAGNFLHEIFEQIDFQDQSKWPLEIHRRFKNDYSSLWTELLHKYQQDFADGATATQTDFITLKTAIVPSLNPHAELVQPAAETDLLQWLLDWLQSVLETPLAAGFQLIQLQPAAYLSEFPFYLSLADHVLAIQRIHQLFTEYAIQMPEFNPANAARYLNGSIDLVYFDGQRYHIADYKSNYLGATPSHYHPAAVQESMTYASYWLQAALYLVALHRYLKLQLQDYQIERDLGGASYLYLRGMNAQPNQGYYYWQPEAEFILRLDAILGYFTEDKAVNVGA
ncbi:exodeoxyribonuclease V beta subunit [Acinetobacter calcoaceticus]|uniref:RecBCD enzyme subunit RecB n=1 Tax=Acinetobacter calcoaceticus TaxID=471 RepID=A0A4R1Y3P1_ACICA|nr:exodeoxyribonuclease V beta subunit [Acinetobacter calcoaceticus]